MRTAAARPRREADDRDRARPAVLGRRVATPEAAAIVGLAAATLEKLRWRGGGPVFCRLGRRVVYDVGDLDRWIAARRVLSGTDDGGDPAAAPAARAAGAADGRG